MNEYLLGLDWSGSQLKIASLKKDGRVYRVEKLDKLVVDVAQEKEAAELIKAWVTENLPEDAKPDAVLTLPESSIFLKELSLPKTSDKELSEAGFWEISSVASIRPRDAIFAWKKISEEEGMTQVSAMVIKNSEALSYLDIFKEAGVRLLAVEPSSMAFTRVTSADFGKTTLLLVIEEEETNLIVLKQGIPVFSTSVSIPLLGARGKKRKLGPKIIKDVAITAQKTISYWEGSEKGKVQQVIITGEGVKYYGLAEEINRFAHIPVVSAKLAIPKEVETKDEPNLTLKRFLISLGAAARLASVEPSSDVNLLPKKQKAALEKERSQKLLQKRISLFTNLNLALLALFVITTLAFQLWGRLLNKNIAQTKRFVENHPAQGLTDEVSNINTLLGDIERLSLEQKDMGERLTQIASLTPANVRFSALEFSGLKDEEWTIAGLGDRGEILAFHQRLSSEEGVKGVSMPYSNLNKSGDNEFEITITW